MTATGQGIGEVGGTAEALRCDTSVKTDVENAVQKAVHAFGGIDVNMIAPMAVTQAVRESIPEAFREQVQQTVPLRRWGTPEDIAHVALFLASEDSRFLTGHTLWVDGGNSIDTAR